MRVPLWVLAVARRSGDPACSFTRIAPAEGHRRRRAGSRRSPVGAGPGGHRPRVADLPARRRRSGAPRRGLGPARPSWRAGATGSTRSSQASTGAAPRLLAPIGWIDRYLVDGVLNALSAWTLRAGDGLRRDADGPGPGLRLRRGLRRAPALSSWGGDGADERAVPRTSSRVIIAGRRFVGALLIMFTARHQPLAVRLIAAMATTGSRRALARLYVALRPRGGRLPVLREAAAGAAARHLLRAGGRRHQPADGPPDGHHHLRRRLRLVDREGARARNSTRCSWRWSPASTASSSRSTSSSSSCSTSWPCCPMYLLIGIWGSSGEVRPRGPFGVGVRRDRRRHEGIRGDEADALPPARAPRSSWSGILALCVEPGVGVVLVPRTARRALPRRGCSAGCSWLFYVGFGVLAGIWPFHTWSPDGHAVGPDRGLDAPRRRPDEARRLRRPARGVGAPARGAARSGLAGRLDRVHQHRLRRALAPWRRRTSST